MNSKLSDFMIALSQNQQLKRDYAASPEATMREHGLCDDEIEAIRSGDESAIYRAAGATEGFTVAKLIFGGSGRPLAQQALKKAA